MILAILHPLRQVGIIQAFKIALLKLVTKLCIIGSCCKEAPSSYSIRKILLYQVGSTGGMDSKYMITNRRCSFGHTIWTWRLASKEHPQLLLL